MKYVPAALALLLFAGCSADDLAGPALAPEGARATTPSDEATLSLAGAWRASDRLGSLTLFIEEVPVPGSSTPRASVALRGKGLVSGHLEAPFAVSVKGSRSGLEAFLLLTDARGATVGKGHGLAADDLSSIKLVLEDAAGQERRLNFERF